jgi:hypothetical protein
MKTNYQPKRTPGSKRIINDIRSYAMANAKKTKVKSKLYNRIVQLCERDLTEYGIEYD